MRHLQKISISNARRFGKDIEIEFGQGATILLAPNGTGKTTVFEAIELALTGSTQRLGNPPFALIRENQPGLYVRLDFDNGKFCEVEYSKGNTPILRGDHNELFNHHSLESVPFLLRLTHLLEQRGKNWIIGAGTEAAGSMLDRISIGRELNQISGKRISVLKAAHKEEEIEKLHLEQAKQNLVDFEGLLNKRNQFALDTKLIPFKEIVNQILHYHDLVVNGEEHIAIDNATSGSASLSHIQSIIDQKVKELARRIEQYNELEGLLPFYDSNSLNVSSKREIIVYLNKEEKLLKNEKQKVTSECETNIQNLSHALNALNALSETRNLFVQLEASRLERNQIKTEIESLKIELLSNKDNLKSLNDKIEKAKALSDRRKLSDEAIEKILSERGELANLEVLQNEWQKLTESIEELSKLTIPNLNKQKSIKSEKLSEIRTVLANAQNEFQASEKSLNLLKEASNTIQGAVSIIAASIPQDKGDCPVCGADYAPKELQARISNALTSINPLVADAVLVAKEASKHLEDIQSKYNEEMLLLGNLSNELKDLEEQLRSINSLINERILPRFPNCKTPSDAFVQNQGISNSIRGTLIKLNRERELLGEELPSEELKDLALRKGEHERRIDALHISINNFSLRLSNVVEKIEDIQIRISVKNKEEILIDIDSKESEINELKSLGERLKSKQTELQENIDKIKQQVISENNFISHIVSQQNVIREKWLAMKLLGEPSKKNLLESKNLTLRKQDELIEARETANTLEVELSRWKTAETFEILDKEIKKKAHPDNEDAFLIKLKDLLKKSESKNHFVSERIRTLNSFFDNVKNQLDTVHKYVESVNPLWRSLLKRVVVNPRFAETTLNSYSKRNKPLADASTLFDGNFIDVADVASEAQLTDLQLTFMMAMAKKYQWTSWKALLLDDPTQHHDLVHSSAVFDLLRDYIIDLDFQVLLGTHDAVQANYFKRKLNNEGVDVKIWNLKADDNGVRAESL